MRRLNSTHGLSAQDMVPPYVVDVVCATQEDLIWHGRLTLTTFISFWKIAAQKNREEIKRLSLKLRSFRHDTSIQHLHIVGMQEMLDRQMRRYHGVIARINYLEETLAKTENELSPPAKASLGMIF